MEMEMCESREPNSSGRGSISRRKHWADEQQGATATKGKGKGFSSGQRLSSSLVSLVSRLVCLVCLVWSFSSLSG